MLKNLKLDWPQVVLASVAIIAFAAVYLFAPEERDMLQKAILAVWAFVASILRPLLSKKEPK